MAEVVIPHAHVVEACFPGLTVARPRLQYLDLTSVPFGEQRAAYCVSNRYDNFLDNSRVQAMQFLMHMTVVNAVWRIVLVTEPPSG